MSTPTLRQLFPCSAGCGTLLASPGMCHRCTEESDALKERYDFNAHKRVTPRGSLGGFFRCAMTIAAAGLLAYILFDSARLFADSWTLGWRPWQ